MRRIVFVKRSNFNGPSWRTETAVAQARASRWRTRGRACCASSASRRCSRRSSAAGRSRGRRSPRPPSSPSRPSRPRSAGWSRAGWCAPPGTRVGQRGRKPVSYVVSSRAGFVVGADIGGSNVRVAAADLFGEPICDLKRPTAKDGSRAVGVQILEMVSEVIDRAGAHHGPPLALGISSPGRRRSGERPGHLAGLQRRARGRLRPARGDPRPLRPAGAGGEQRQPRGGRRAVVRPRPGRLDDGVHRDRRRDRHGDHHRRPGGARRARRRRRDRLPAAGRRSVQSAPPPARRPRGRDRRHRDRRGVQRAPGREAIPSSPRSRRCSTCAASGSATAQGVVDHVASRLGTAIATVCAILDPELVVLGGGIGASPLLLRPVRGAAAALVPMTARIETSLLGERAALQGAIAVALHAARTSLLSPVALPR